jgi:hypothetical protein
MKRYLFAVTIASSLAFAFAMGCSSSSGGTGGSAGSTGGAGTTGSGGTAGKSGGGSGCSTVSGSGSEESCIYSDDSLGNTCTAPATSGSCPPSGLQGCCVAVTQVSGYTLTTATCIYDSSLVSGEMSECNKTATSKWQTTAP